MRRVENSGSVGAWEMKVLDGGRERDFRSGVNVSAVLMRSLEGLRM